MKIIIDLETDNDAFQQDPPTELMRILLVTISKISGGIDGGPLMDINGNTVGKFDVEV